MTSSKRFEMCHSISLVVISFSHRDVSADADLFMEHCPKNVPITHSDCLLPYGLFTQCPIKFAPLSTSKGRKRKIALIIHVIEILPFFPGPIITKQYLHSNTLDISVRPEFKKTQVFKGATSFIKTNHRSIH